MLVWEWEKNEALRLQLSALLMSPGPYKLSPPIAKGKGVTDAERYLQALCDRTFLSLWSYPSVYRDQGIGGSAHSGKEVADLLVVFGDDVIVFSDKDCAFPDSGDIATDWRRWFKRAVLKSAQQAWGAERRLRDHPGRLYLDPACQEPFPIDLPAPDRLRVHHIVVAHNATARCQRYFGGGSGSFVLNSHVRGRDHFDASGPATGPFVIGDLDPARGFVHVFEDRSLRIVLETLDTVADFTAYLRKKENLFRSDTAFLACGEEDLLARYLMKLDPDGTHGFDIPPGFNAVMIEEGMWADFARNPQRLAQIEADRISYTWDRLIETFTRHIIGGRYYQATDPSPRVREQIVRFFAAEPRFRRRILGRAIRDLVTSYPDDGRDWKSARVVPPGRPCEPYYVFLVLAQPSYCASYEEYREVRGKLLEAYCLVVKHRFPDALDVIGLATGPVHGDDHSEDAMWLDARDWPPELAADAANLHETMGLLSEITMTQGHDQEYPDPSEMGKNPRNKPCWCGSGQKFKRCHGRATACHRR